MRRAALFFVIMALAGAAAALWLWVTIAVPYRNFPSEGVFIVVPHGASCRTVGRLLQQEGVVRSGLVFRLYCRRHPKRSLQAGEYFFEQAASGRDVFWTIANGKIFEKQFTVREGTTIFEIARELEAARMVSAADFLKAAEDPASIHELAPEAQTLEGFLFPATYRFPRNPGAEAVTGAMTGKFKEEWTRIQSDWAAKRANSGAEAAAKDPPKQKLLAVVTLASLVERETPQAEERPVVAGVYENRLKKRMLLQCDPTVIYALERVDSYQGTLTLDDLRIDSPYNTYRYRGLPPGPIGNPGEAALRAALEPATSSYLYFVANTKGGHFFSNTLAEHNWNVRRYHRLLKGLPDEPEPPPPAAAAPAPHKNSRHAAGNKQKSKSTSRAHKRRATS
ncbi:MAG: endolytic transglycosylase MltG [Acidobacteriia bacterium]|nr:endolytic transglycosylase MltG [Terriglobia bacterium]